MWVLSSECEDWAEHWVCLSLISDYVYSWSTVASVQDYGDIRQRCSGRQHSVQWLSAGWCSEDQIITAMMASCHPAGVIRVGAQHTRVSNEGYRRFHCKAFAVIVKSSRTFVESSTAHDTGLIFYTVVSESHEGCLLFVRDFAGYSQGTALITKQISSGIWKCENSVLCVTLFYTILFSYSLI